MTSAQRHEARYQRRKAKREEKAKATLYAKLEDVFTFENMYKAGKSCCNGVRWKTSTINFENDLLSATAKNLNEIFSGTYKFDGFKSFTSIEHGKKRDIDAIHIKDRQVQKCLCDFIMTPAYSRTFIYENGASLPGKGMHFVLERAKEDVRHHYRKYGMEGGILLFDFSKYFNSIPHEIAKERVRLHLKDPKLRDFICALIDDFQEMRTFNKEDPVARGVGLGSQISQLIALDYVSPIDHYFKDFVGVEAYGRYMDDGYVISDSLEELEELREALFELVDALDIKLNKKKTVIVPFRGNSFRFLKARFTLLENGKVLMKPGKKTIKSMRRRLFKFREKLDAGEMMPEDVFASYQSWRAHIRKFDSYKTLEAMDTWFIDLFAEELAVRNKKFPCTLKATMTAWGWRYSKHGVRPVLKEEIDMEYIVHHRFKGMGIRGEVNLPRGTVVNLVGKYLVDASGIICAVTSENAKKYFARNDDGLGLLRGELTHAIAYRGVNKPGYRFTSAQRNTLATKYERFLREDTEFILFNDKFFAASVEDLQKMAEDLGIKV
jgi:hypothetical protein